jgi:ethanolamine utilization cobalamin adenosyltransferase
MQNVITAMPSNTAKDEIMRCVTEHPSRYMQMTHLHQKRAKILQKLNLLRFLNSIKILN